MNSKQHEQTHKNTQKDAKKIKKTKKVLMYIYIYIYLAWTFMYNVWKLFLGIKTTAVTAVATLSLCSCQNPAEENFGFEGPRCNTSFCSTWTCLTFSINGTTCNRVNNKVAKVLSLPVQSDDVLDPEHRWPLLPTLRNVQGRGCCF